MLYADDFNLFCSNSKIKKNINFFLQKSINNLVEWSKYTGFNVSLEKSQRIVFSGKHNNMKLNIKMEQLFIKEKKLLRFLE